MGASNWGRCFRCLKAAKQQQEDLQKQADSAYGHVPASTYQEMVRAANVPILVGETLCEDWSLGINEDGEFYVHYGVTCEICGFEFMYAASESVVQEETIHL